MTDVGARLREARERKGISLREIAAATKISLHTLEAVERNDLSRLPGGIFNRGFVRSYAVEVGLDPDEIVREFVAQSAGESPPDLAHDPSGGSHRREPGFGIYEATSNEAAFESERRIAAVVLKLVLISVAATFVIFYFRSLDRGPEMEIPPARSAVEGAPSDLPAAPADQTGATPDEGGVPATRPSEPPPVRGAATVPGADLSAPEPAVVPGVRLEIAPTGECWVQLTTDGEVVLSRVLAAGERQAHTFQQSAVLQVGDAAACELSINGRPARPLGNPRQVRQVVLTRDNYSGFLQ
jgi:cytoskeleton protein RodZ